jgi:uncharacterized protein YigE (DUF2233 family)
VKTTRKFACFFLIAAGLIAFVKPSDDKIISYTVDLKKQDLQLYWKNDDGEILSSIENLKSYVEGKNQTLVFAANAGMYQQDNTPLGLFIQNGKTHSPLNTRSADGNFYLKPNGVFYVVGNNALIATTENFKANPNIKYATQSGPMLVIDGKIHSAFRQGSPNVNIRNGVGILPVGKVVFAMSKDKINFYEFAEYFKELGCKNALYLDGFVSRTYLPEKKWLQTDGNFGVMIGVTKNTGK